jgi:cytosine permease
MAHSTADVHEPMRDDYALSRVPQEARYSWWTVAVQRFGQLSALSQFLLGAALGFGMRFWDAVLAVTLGAVLLELVAIFTGIMGQREGLSTSLISRWTGFGRFGSSLISVMIALSLIGWFGVQSGVSASALHEFMPFLPEWAWSLVFGLAVTAVVIYGFKSMAIIAYIAVPAFLALAGWSIVSELSRHDLGTLMSTPPAGPVLGLGAGATLVAGGFIVGMVITPDMSRFNRSTRDVIKQTVVGVTLGEYVVCLAGVLLAHALRTSDIITIVTSTSGFVGAVVVIAGTLKMNDWNLYSATLGVVNFLQSVFRWRVSRTTTTWVAGAVGSVLAAAGILDHFIEFLTLLGVVIPPVAAIMVVDYFVLKTWRRELDEAGDGLPEREPTWVPGTLVVWAVSALIGKFLTVGIASVNSLLAAFLLYYLFGRLGLLRPHKIAATALVPADQAEGITPTHRAKETSK